MIQNYTEFSKEDRLVANSSTSETYSFPTHHDLNRIENFANSSLHEIFERRKSSEKLKVIEQNVMHQFPKETPRYLSVNGN